MLASFESGCNQKSQLCQNPPLGTPGALQAGAEQWRDVLLVPAALQLTARGWEKEETAAASPELQAAHCDSLFNLLFMSGRL